MDEPGEGRIVYRYTGRSRIRTILYPPQEALYRIIVNDEELVALLCSPQKLDCLAVGYLYTDGRIESPDEIRSVYTDTKKREIRVTLTGELRARPKDRILTSGFGGGIISGREIFKKCRPPDKAVSPRTIIALAQEMKDAGVMYKRSGGVHSTALCTEKGIAVQAEDIGRHNTMDKAAGEYFLSGLSDRIDVMMTTGRMSSEMVMKAAAMGIPITASLSTPTMRAVEVAERCGVTTIGYAGRKGITIYSGFENIADPEKRRFPAVSIKPSINKK